MTLVNGNLSRMMMLITAGVGTMKTEKEWAEQVKGMLKAELKRRGVTYDGLSARLQALGVEETPENIANKISRGKFTAIFLIQCMEAIGCKTLPLSMD